MLELLEPARKLGRGLSLFKQGGQADVVPLQLPANLKKFCRGREIIPDVMSAIQQRYELVPSGAQDGRRTREVRVDEFAIGLLCDFRLDGFAEKQTGQKPFEQLLFILRFKIDTQAARVRCILRHWRCVWPPFVPGLFRRIANCLGQNNSLVRVQRHSF
jgi:hypothetical protein